MDNNASDKSAHAEQMFVFLNKNKPSGRKAS
jgi:hypothetical protein